LFSIEVFCEAAVMSSDSSQVEQSQSESGAAEQKSNPQRILIGTQRPGHAAEDIKAKPVPPPAAFELKAMPEPPTPPAPVKSENSAPASAAEAAITSSAGTTTAPASPPPSPPQVPIAPAKQRQHYPPPNIRDRLSPEMEAEYEAALGDLSLENLINEGSGATLVADLAPETRITGRVAKIHGDDVFIDLSGRNQGVVPFRQFEDAEPKPGEEVDLIVVRFDAEEGLYELARPTAAVSVGNWSEVREGQIIEVTITGANKGGLECQVAGIRGFIPMGQVSIYRVENPEEMVGQRLACVVTEAKRDRQNLVLSHRAVMERERNELRDKMMAELATGQLHEGVVRSLKDFGAFVDLGGMDGLIHISQLSWDRVKHPSEVLEVGQKVKVRIEKFDKDTGKISLSYREVGANPWQNVESKYPVGNRAKGTVSRLMDFGAFVKLEPGVEGLIHISELGHGRVFRASDVVSEGQEVEVKILSVDAENQRISLSLKALMSAPVKPGQQKVADEDMPLPPGAPKAPKKQHAELKGGTGGPSGGERFGLNW
jgi:predicted RNA-binding protein with RPS1 domain